VFIAPSSGYECHASEGVVALLAACQNIQTNAMKGDHTVTGYGNNLYKNAM